MPTHTRTHRPLVITRNGQHISISDEVLNTLGDLTGRCLIASGDSRHGYDVRRASRSLLVSPEGSWIPNAGCLPMLRHRASQRGIQLIVHDEVPITPLPQPRNTPSLHFQQLAQFVFQHPRGLIKRPSRVPVEELIYDLALAFPDHRMVVLGNHVQQLDKIRARLATKIEDVQSVHAHRPIVVNEDDPMPRIVCSTFSEAAEVDLATSDIVLLLDAYHCVHDRAQHAIATMDGRFRLFGLTATGRKVSPSEADLAMAVFGPELLEVSSRGQSRRKVHVACVPVSGPKYDISKDDPKHWSKCYWHNERRNRLIRQLAEGLVSGNVPRSRKFRQVVEGLRLAGKSRCSVTILVQQLPHARALAKALPGWDIIAGEIPLNRCPGSFRNRVKKQRRRWTTGQRQIVLADAAEKFRGETSDVVIWTGGGKFADAVPDTWLYADDGAATPLLIVDLHDFHHATADCWSQCRKRGYYERNIFPPGVLVGQGRAALFLSQQRQHDGASA